MDIKIKLKSIAGQWFLNVFLVVFIFVGIIALLMCSFVRAIYIDRVRSISSEYAQEFTVLATVAPEQYYAAARECVETFSNKDKLEIEVLNNAGNVIFTTSGLIPEEDEMPDYAAAQKNKNGTAYSEIKTKYGESVLCGTSILPDMGSGSNGAIRWRVSLSGTNRYVLYLRTIIIAVGIIVLAVTALSGNFFLKSIIKPIREASSIARKIAAGDFNNKIEIHKNNEIGELCDSINYMANELKSADSMKNDFISSVSHELRTPLTAIRGWGETAKMSLGSDPQTVEKGLDVVLKESDRLAALVEELLDFSRMQSGRLSVNMCPIKVSVLLSEVADMYKELALKQGIELGFSVPIQDSTIMGDADRLKQVFINIVDNAVKYTEQGGQVLIEQYEEEGCVRVVVKDTGVGIPAQDIDRVKEKFFKSNKTVRGSGIGLAVADEIIKQHEGLLFVESDEGVGTTVTVALPIYVAKPEPEPELILPDAENNKGESNE